MKNKKPLALYLHIPFCKQKCLYCDFLSAPASRKEQTRYVEALLCDCRQTLQGLGENYEVATVFIGGGTPSLLPVEQIAALLDEIRKHISFVEKAEVTMEMNPGTLRAGYLKKLYAAGVNRLSLGLQSVHESELHTLGRIHSYQDFLHAFDEAREAGFLNINVDLMYNLPGQTLKSWQQTLERVMKLQPEHISAYSLIIEEGTPFYQAYGSGTLELPVEEELEAMDALTADKMAEYQYEQYEISNYAKKGYACRHNLCYWERGEYIGLGLGASSFFQGERFRRCVDLGQYINQKEIGEFTREDVHPVCIKEAMEEFMFLGLRLTKGVKKDAFYRCFGKTVYEVYEKTLEKLQRQGLLCDEDGRLFLSDRGRMMGNYVFSAFLI